MWVVPGPSASDPSTVVVGVSYDQSMKASDFSIDEKASPSQAESARSESKDGIQMQMVVHEEKSALHKDTSQLAPKQDGYSDWENNLKLETEDTRARTQSWAKIAEGVLTFVRHIHTTRLYCSHIEVLIRPVFSPWCWLHFSSSAFRCYSRIQLIPPTGCLLPTISCLPKSSGPNSHRHSRRLLPTTRILPSDLAILPCV
jgi:hypothetical protein